MREQKPAPSRSWFHFIRRVPASDRRSNPTTRREGADDLAANRLARLHEIIEQAIDNRFVKCALVAVALEIKLERFQLNAQRARRVGERDGAEIGLAGLGTQTGEFGTDDLDGVITSGLGIREGFQLLGGRGIDNGHGCSSDKC